MHRAKESERLMSLLNIHRPVWISEPSMHAPASRSDDEESRWATVRATVDEQSTTTAPPTSTMRLDLSGPLSRKRSTFPRQISKSGTDKPKRTVSTAARALVLHRLLLRARGLRGQDLPYTILQSVLLDRAYEGARCQSDILDLTLYSL